MIIYSHHFREEGEEQPSFMKQIVVSPMIPSRPQKTSNLVRIFSGYRKHFSLFLMFLPAVLCFAVFNYSPMYGLTMAFKDYNMSKGILGSPWIGLTHFRTLFSSHLFVRSLRNTIIISVLKWVVCFPSPIVFSLLLNEVRQNRFKKAVQTISYLPHFLSWVILAGIFTQLLSPSTGVVNNLIRMMGGNSIYFLADNKWFRSVLVITDLWKGIGWGTIVYLAAISSISPQLYEAAECDGASRFMKMLHITVPSLAPVITILLILSTGNILNAGFDQIFNLYNDAVLETGDIFDTYMYRNGLEKLQYAQSTAVGLIKNAVGFFMVIGTNVLAKRINEYGLW